MRLLHRTSGQLIVLLARWTARGIGTLILHLIAMYAVGQGVHPARITGAFLAYCYAHFAAVCTWRAIIATAAFHAAINVVGFATLATS